MKVESIVVNELNTNKTIEKSIKNKNKKVTHKKDNIKYTKFSSSKGRKTKLKEELKCNFKEILKDKAKFPFEIADKATNLEEKRKKEDVEFKIKDEKKNADYIIQDLLSNSKLDDINSNSHRYYFGEGDIFEKIFRKIFGEETPDDNELDEEICEGILNNNSNFSN